MAAIERLYQLKWQLLGNQTSLYSYRQPQDMSKCVGFGGTTSV